ncbi:P2X purinoceptor 3 isoform X4 [Calonectris borealis]|uniref:P2X purinoceptor 3 isoform X4 n=1 Tax=Calonectris borealis TaxID=1323832 RepID=UPI003F4BBE13
MPPPRPGTRWVTDFFSYETTKSVVVKSWVVGAINRGVQLLILTYFIGWVFLHEKAYQVRDTVIESSVVTKVKGIGHYAGRVLDTADYVTPHQVRGLRAPGSLPCLSFPSRMARGAARVTVTYPPGHLGVRGGHQADPDGEPGAGRLPGERSRVPLHGRPRLPGEEPRHGQRGADRALRPLQRDPAHLRDPGLVPAGGGHRRRVSVTGDTGGQGSLCPLRVPRDTPSLPQPRHAGGRKLHPLHQEQHPLPALRLREGQPAAPRQRGGAGAVPVPPRAAAPLPHPAAGGRGAPRRAGLPHAGRHRGGAGHQDRVGVRPGPRLGALPAPLLLHPPGRPRPHPRPRLQLQARQVLPLAGRHRAPHPHQGLRHPLRRPGVWQRTCGARGFPKDPGGAMAGGDPPPTGVSALPGREVRHCPHPHQHGGSFHLHWRGHGALRYHPAQLPEGSRALQGPQVRGGARGWRARTPHQPHGVSPRGAGGLQPRQAVH